MTKQEHIEIHKKLHTALDQLVADLIMETDDRAFYPSRMTVLELVKWSHQQTIEPSDVQGFCSDPEEAKPV